MTIKRIKIARSDADEVSIAMQKLGFSDYETRIYAELVQTESATAYEISRATGVPRSNTYDALTAMSQRGVVQPVSEDPIRYAAVDPEVMLGRIANSTRELCDDLALRFSKMRRSEGGEVVWTTRGEQAVHDQVHRMISQARRYIWIKAADTVIERHADDLRAAVQRGVEVLIVLFGTEPDRFRFSDKVQIFLHEGTGRRLGMADNLFTIAVDHKEVLAASTEDSVFGAYTQHPSVVTIALSLIRHEFYLACLFSELGPDMERAFGPHLLSLREMCFTPEQLAVFRQKMGLP